MSGPVSVLEVGAALEEDRIAYDALYEFLVTPQMHKRMAIVAWLKKRLLYRFGHELANDPETDELFQRHFDRLLDTDCPFPAVQRLHQTYLLLVMLMFDAVVQNYFCSPPPSNNVVLDECRCDRVAFQHFLTFVSTSFVDLELAHTAKSVALSTHTLPNFVVACVERYVSLLPQHSTLTAGRPCTKRMRPADSIPTTVSSEKKQKSEER